MGGSFRHLRLLVWKNYVLQKRRPVRLCDTCLWLTAAFAYSPVDHTSSSQIATAVEIAMPIIFMILLAIMRVYVFPGSDDLQVLG